MSVHSLPMQSRPHDFQHVIQTKTKHSHCASFHKARMQIPEQGMCQKRDSDRCPFGSPNLEYPQPKDLPISHKHSICVTWKINFLFKPSVRCHVSEGNLKGPTKTERAARSVAPRCHRPVLRRPGRSASDVPGEWPGEEPARRQPRSGIRLERYLPFPF